MIAYYIQQGAGEGPLAAATCGLCRCNRLCTFSVQIYVQKPRGMTEQPNNTRFYYHNVEAETVIWVRIRDHHERCALTSPKTTASKESRREYWIGPRDGDHIFFFLNWVCPSISLHVNCCAPGNLRTSLVPCLQVPSRLIASCHIIHFH